MLKRDDGNPTLVMRALTSRFQSSQRDPMTMDVWYHTKVVLKLALTGDRAAINQLETLGAHEAELVDQMRLENLRYGGLANRNPFRYTRFRIDHSTTMDFRIVKGTELTFKGVKGRFKVLKTPERNDTLHRYNRLECKVFGGGGATYVDRNCVAGICKDGTTLTVDTTKYKNPLLSSIRGHTLDGTDLVEDF